MQRPDPQPFIVTITQEPTPETTFGDVLLGAAGVVLALALLAVVLGGLLSLVRLAWNRRFPPEDDRLPPVAPAMPDARVPPSSQAR